MQQFRNNHCWVEQTLSPHQTTPLHDAHAYITCLLRRALACHPYIHETCAAACFMRHLLCYAQLPCIFCCNVFASDLTQPVWKCSKVCATRSHWGGVHRSEDRLIQGPSSAQQSKSLSFWQHLNLLEPLGCGLYQQALFRIRRQSASKLSAYFRNEPVCLCKHCLPYKRALARLFFFFSHERTSAVQSLCKCLPSPANSARVAHAPHSGSLSAAALLQDNPLSDSVLVLPSIQKCHCLCSQQLIR